MKILRTGSVGSYFPCSHKKKVCKERNEFYETCFAQSI